MLTFTFSLWDPLFLFRTIYTRTYSKYMDIITPYHTSLKTGTGPLYFLLMYLQTAEWK